jgi:hypothetical protein
MLTVTLSGLREFRRFTLVVDASPSVDSEVSPQRVGSYQLFGGDSATTFNPDCINTVSEARDEAKAEERSNERERLCGAPVSDRIRELSSPKHVTSFVSITIKMRVEN